MHCVESQWWIMEIPAEWDARQEEEAIVISDEDGVGDIVITTLEKKQGSVSDQELREFAKDVEKTYGKSLSVALDKLEGYYYSYREEDDALREWYLRYGSLLVLITYSCDQSNAGMDDSAVDDILSTLFVKDENTRLS